MNRETIKTRSKIDEFRKLNIEQYDLPDKAKKIEEFSEEKYHFVGFENKYLELQQLSLPISSSKDSVIKGTPTIHNGKRLRLKKKAKVMRSYHAISANAALGMTPIQRPGFKPT